MKKNLFTTAVTFVIILIAVTVSYDILKYLIFGTTPVDLFSLRFWISIIIIGFVAGLILAYIQKRMGEFKGN